MYRFCRMLALGVGFSLTVASAAMAEPKVLAGVAYEEIVRGKPADGAVIPLLRPSWLMAAPRTRARTRSPSRCASENRLSTRIPHPSPRT